MFLRSFTKNTPAMSARSYSTTTATNGKFFLLKYNYVDDMLNKRVPHREAHLKHANAHVEKGQLLLGGAHGDVKAADLVFKVPEESIVRQFAENDPYVTQGLVTKWEVKPWNVVVGVKSLL